MAQNNNQGFSLEKLTGGLTDPYKVLQKMSAEVLTIEKALTQLRAATGMTEQQAASLMKTYTELGRRLNITGTELAASASQWLRQGKSIQDAQKLVESSLVLAKTGGISSQEADKFLSQATQAYRLSADQLAALVDQVNAMDLSTSLDTGSLTQAFSQLAVGASAAGVETEKLLSYLAVMGEKSGGGISSAADALETMLSRLEEAQISKLFGGSGQDASGLERSLSQAGVSLTNSMGQLRAFDQVLEDIAARWGSLEASSKLSIANAFAGTENRNGFDALMENYSLTQRYTQLAQQSSGQAMKSYEAYQDSLEGKIQGLKNSFQGLSDTALDTDLFTGLVEGGTSALDFLDGFIDKVGLLGTVLAGATIKKGLSGLKTNLGSPENHRGRKFPIFYTVSHAQVTQTRYGRSASLWSAEF